MPATFQPQIEKKSTRHPQSGIISKTKAMYDYPVYFSVLNSVTKGSSQSSSYVVWLINNIPG